VSERQSDTAGVVVPPPLIYLAALLVAFTLDWLWPVALLPEGLQYGAGAVLIGGGLLIAILVWRRFHAAGTHIEPYKPTIALVTDGLFAYSRNPVYLALACIMLGIGVAADNAWVLLMLVPTLLIIRTTVIAREERYLEGKFGDDYRRYKAAVRRWI
jgi:protein-S-isoprenylcysteine O-methyltransferase Ste14